MQPTSRAHGDYLELQSGSSRTKTWNKKPLCILLLLVWVIVAAVVVAFMMLLSDTNVHKTSDEMAEMPLPFIRELKVINPVMQGYDVLIATTLMSRCPCWPSNIKPSLEYTSAVASAVAKFQTDVSVASNGIFGANTANETLFLYSYDGYVDDKVKASDYDALYKIFIPVHNDSARDIELMGQLLDADNQLLFTFKTRTHGSNNPPTNAWPKYNNSVGLNEFTSNGNTPTGLSYLDLNSPEPAEYAKNFGIYPVHRVVKGIVYRNRTTNMGLLLQPDTTNIRSGILLHTGQWPDWNEGDQMPNSDGCIHISPQALQTINDIVTKQLGVVVNNNTFSGKDYPYKPQGIISIQQIRISK
eukprot:541313_1